MCLRNTPWGPLRSGRPIQPFPQKRPLYKKLHNLKTPLLQICRPNDHITNLLTLFRPNLNQTRLLGQHRPKMSYSGQQIPYSRRIPVTLKFWATCSSYSACFTCTRFSLKVQRDESTFRTNPSN